MYENAQVFLSDFVFITSVNLCRVLLIFSFVIYTADAITIYVITLLKYILSGQSLIYINIIDILVQYSLNLVFYLYIFKENACFYSIWCFDVIVY